MTERWENELQQLREIRLPEHVRLRVDEGPRGHGLPPRPHRVVAAVVAFSVFAVAGAFAWRAFRPTAGSTLGGSAMPMAIVSFLASGQGDAGLPRGEMTFEGRTIEGQMESFGWDTAIIDTSTPEYREPLRIEPETLIEVRGDAESVSGALAVVEGDTPFPWEPTLDLDFTSGSAEVRLEPGTYALAFTASWPQGSPTFWFPIEVVDSEVVGIAADAAVIEVSRDPVGATLTFGDQMQQGIVTDVWEPTGEPDDSHRAVLPELDEFQALIEVPAGTELSIIGDVDGWTVFPQPEFDVVRLAREPGPAVFAVRTGWHGVAFDVAFGVDILESTGSPDEDEMSTSDGGEVSDRLIVRCDETGIEVLTPVVAAQPDGLHVQARVSGLRDPEIELRSEAQPGFAWWSGSSGVDGEFVRDVHVGAAIVHCESGPGQSDGPEDFEARFEIVDPDGHFVEYGLDCRDAETIASVPTSDQAPDPIELIRSTLPGTRAQDVIERAGYRESGPRVWFRIVREGSVIASVYLLDLSDRGRGWSFTHGDVCHAAGLASALAGAA
jgi:hypothetical protein